MAHGGNQQMGASCRRAIKNLTTRRARAALVIFCLGSLLACNCLTASGDSSTPVLSSRAAFLRAQRASRQLQQAHSTNQTSNTTTTAAAAAATSSSSAPITLSTSTTTTTSSPAPSRPVSQPSGPSTSRPRLQLSGRAKEESASRSSGLVSQQQATAVVGANRTTRTADVFQNGDGYNIFVTNTCEREQMQVKITTSREFNGVIHTRNQRQKAACTIEGDGGTEYNMIISHVLNASDPNYCGVIKARRESPDDKDLLSVVIAVRFHRNVELSDDKFFLLNCTNRCRKPDCSAPTSENLTTRQNARYNLRPEDNENGSLTNTPSGNADERKVDEADECTIWRFPWVIALLWAMGIFLVFMMIAMCVMCSSLVCKRVKTEVVEREPSVYEDDTTDDEDKLYNRKNNPMRIDYDNRDIYKTSNNYQPYSLDEVQAAERQQKQKRARKSKSSQRR